MTGKEKIKQIRIGLDTHKMLKMRAVKEGVTLSLLVERMFEHCFRCDIFTSDADWDALYPPPP